MEELGAYIFVFVVAEMYVNIDLLKTVAEEIPFALSYIVIISGLVFDLPAYYAELAGLVQAAFMLLMLPPILDCFFLSIEAEN